MGKITRRAFIGTGLLTSGALVIGISIRPGNRAKKVASLISDPEEHVFNVWIKISPDNSVTVIVPHAEMGQGIHTTLAMMLADELDADWGKVNIQEAPAHQEYANHMMLKGFVAGDVDFPNFLVKTVDGAFLKIGKFMSFQVTGGSASVRFTGELGMRWAGASTKHLLLTAAAQKWQVPKSELYAVNSFIHHEKSNRKAPFSTFSKEASLLDAPSSLTLKTIAEYRLMGSSPMRKDLPPKVTGKARFGIDVVLPNMKYATLKNAPVFGGKLISVDDTAIEQLSGFHQVIKLDNAVALVAEGYWQAKQALDKLIIEFTRNDQDTIDQKDIFNQLNDALDKAIKSDNFTTDLELVNQEYDVLTSSSYTANYQVPFLAHATMEPMNCTVWLHDGICEIWIGSQNPLGVRAAIAELLELAPDKVFVYNQFLGGGFGRRSETDVALQAALIAKEISAPVKLIWSREEDIQHDFYREANISRFNAVLSKEGPPISWTNQFLFKHHPPEAAHIPYSIPNQLIQYTETDLHVPWGNWRSVDHSMHGFFIESFIDELANQQQQDPYQYRRKLLKHQPRFLKVLDLVAKKANWRAPLPHHWGRGIAIHKSFGTIVAQVAEVAIIEGKLIIHRVVCVADAGFAMHKDAFIAQMESGIIYGLTAALYGEISIKEGAVQQRNFNDYPMLRIKETPKIETFIINSLEKIGGAGEPSTPVIAPAVTNAIFNVSGKRIRELPINQHLLTV